MKPTLLEKIALGLSGITALTIGASILFVPHTFYTSYGITLGDDVNLLSELRAPGAALAGFGLLMLLGIWRQAVIRVGMVAALTVFIAFPVGRLVGLIVDGMPSTNVIEALGVELIIAVLCVASFRKRLWRPGIVSSKARPA